MINLLPPEEKEILLAERTKRLAIVWGIIVLSALVCLLFIMLSMYFFASGEIKSQSFYFQEAEKSYQSPDSETFKSVMQKYNKILPQIQSFYDSQVYFSDALNAIYSVPRPEGVSILGLSLGGAKQNANKKEISASIGGVSATRENLITFQNNLLKRTLIEDVSFSPESWINSKDANFKATFSLIQSENGK